MDLITRMLQRDPNDRPTMEDIRAHSWFVDPSVPTSEEFHTDFTLRKTKLGGQGESMKESSQLFSEHTYY